MLIEPNCCNKVNKLNVIRDCFHYARILNVCSHLVSMKKKNVYNILAFAIPFSWGIKKIWRAEEGEESI